VLGRLSENYLVLEYDCSYWCLDGTVIVYVFSVQLFGRRVKIVTGWLCVCVDKVSPSSPLHNPSAHLRPTHLELRRIKRITKQLFAQSV
jgi:hypothetical protein